MALAAVYLFSAQRPPAEAEKIAERVLQQAIIIDTHADTPQMMLDEGYDLAQPDSPFMVSIPKMRQGHLGAEFFSIWVDVDWPKQDLIHRALDLIDVVYEQVAAPLRTSSAWPRRRTKSCAFISRGSSPS